jgi:CRISPR/Cas system-associated endonuclease Cas1
MHDGRDGSSAFIFDLMEPERPAIDLKVLEFVRGHVFDAADLVSDEAPNAILADYQARKDESGFAVRSFIDISRCRPRDRPFAPLCLVNRWKHILRGSGTS